MGLPVVSREDLDDQTRETMLGLLSEYCLRMLQAGVQLSRLEWEALGEIERSAFASAGNQHRIKQALRIGEANQGHLGRAKVIAEMDGGELLEEAILESHVSGLHKLKQEERLSRAR